MDVAIEERHDHRCVQAMAGDVADDECPAAVRHGDEVEIVTTQPLGHEVSVADAVPAADRRALGQKELLHVAGKLQFQFCCVSHGLLRTIAMVANKLLLLQVYRKTADLAATGKPVPSYQMISIAICDVLRSLYAGFRGSCSFC